MNKIILLTSVLSLVFITSCSKKAEDHSKKPNIIFIMTDDHTTQAIGAYGGRLASLNPTPNIDALASEGMLFTSAFCTNSICTPSRANILTGQYSQTNGVLDLDGHLDSKNQYLPQEMKKLGYNTAVIGKWHLFSEPAAFDYYKVLPEQGKYFDPDFREKGKGSWPSNMVTHEGYASDIITDLTIDYLNNRDKERPFFLLHHHKAPHGPFSRPSRYDEYLKNIEIPEPASLYNQPYFGSEATRGKNDSLINYIGSSISSRHRLHPSSAEDGDLATHNTYQGYLKDYLGCARGVDDNLERLFHYLKKEGLWENTVIIYTSDQGMMLGEHDFKDKRWMYEESMRMPFIVHYPNMIKAKQQSDLLINNTDFAPTMIELAGGKTPDYMQGRSFINTLEGKPEDNWRTATYYRYWMHIIHHYVPAHFGIRTNRYKLIFYYGTFWRPKEEYANFYWADEYEGIDRNTTPGWELYDLENDPEELRNRYNDPEYKDIIAELKGQLKKQRQELNETDVYYPEIQSIIDAHWND
ncbi:sulfatase family protein [Seonamhaeicola maritimus]|uniref:sulfatase family protein n=1 Tax=Seonamhaeicola maritimus TaxID=2591822 RepID=UPI002493F5BB|nr:sulfatase [Seonamhaeicola maritimus]